MCMEHCLLRHSERERNSVWERGESAKEKENINKVALEKYNNLRLFAQLE